MHKNYGQLTYEERVSIKLWKHDKVSLRKIASRLNRNVSTISRELKRNLYSSPYGNSYAVYIPVCAQNKACKRRDRVYARCPITLLKSKKNQEYVEKHLKRGWSPEVIAGRMHRSKVAKTVSYEAIYQWLYKERRDLLIYLVRHHKQRKKRHQSKMPTTKRYDTLGSVANRPAKINKRAEFGHWESDSMVSDQSLVALHVAVERKSRYSKVSQIKRNRAIDVKRALVKRMKNLPQKARASFTYDRGGENALHAEIDSLLNSKTYFCAAYRGWEKGTVENTIGVIRRTIRKRTDLGRFSYNQIRRLEAQLNTRPRKCLGYRTPEEVFKKELVALQC